MSDIKLILGLPKDKSLKAYKDWILKTAAAVVGGDPSDFDDMTDQDWERDWREFWAEKGKPPQG